MDGSALFHLDPCHVRLPRADACRPALWMDALMTRRALFERSELARPPLSCVHLLEEGRTGRQWFWLLLPKQKGLGCRAETRQHRKSLLTILLL